MATAKGRSINTLRTQAKSLLRKTKMKTQSELVRIFSALIDKCKLPVDFYHSTDEMLIPLRQVEDMVAKRAEFSLTTVEGGQLVLYKWPEKTLDGL